MSLTWSNGAIGPCLLLRLCNPSSRPGSMSSHPACTCLAAESGKGGLVVKSWTVQVGAVVSILFTLFLFQSCGTASFTAKGSLVETDDVTTAGGVQTPPAGGGGAVNPPVTNPPVSNPPVTNPPATNPPVVNPPVNPPPHQCHCSDDGHNGHGGCKDDDDSDAPDRRLHVCVLMGNGKSKKVAFVNSELLGKVGTPADVCMTAKACNEIVSQAFEVRGPERRGFCPDKNPHVVHFSNAEIQALIDDLKN